MHLGPKYIRWPLLDQDFWIKKNVENENVIKRFKPYLHVKYVQTQTKILYYLWVLIAQSIEFSFFCICISQLQIQWTLEDMEFNFHLMV